MKKPNSIKFYIATLFVATTWVACLPEVPVAPVGGGAPVDVKLEAIKKTIQQNAVCRDLGDFYWSVGDKTGRLLQGQVGSSFNANTHMDIFSASKLLFSTYVVQKTNGNLTDSLIKGLNFTSGYIGPNENICNAQDTIMSCFQRELSAFDPNKVGVFQYASGHMQKIAAMDMGMGALNINTLSTEIRSVLGNDLDITYTTSENGIHAGPILAGAAGTTAENYERFLKKLLNREYLMYDYLGTHAVSTGAPAPKYSLGHWIESDGAFNSVGALGFLPWIDSTKQYWGIIARVERRNLLKAVFASLDSQNCGAAIRKAFLTGTAQP